MIDFDDVHKVYKGGQSAITGMDLHIPAGEMVFLTGHSGAGKSSFLRLLALLDKPSHGQLKVNGHNLGQIPAKQIPYYRRKVGMIFQNHRLLMDRTVFDNVAMPLVVTGVRHQELQKRVRAALDKVGLLKKEKAFPMTLSGGEQQRVGIARAVVSRPPLLLADEPTGNLDPELSRDIIELFKRFNDLGVTTIIATHDIELVPAIPKDPTKIASMNERILVLKESKLAWDNRSHAVQEEEI